MSTGIAAPVVGGRADTDRQVVGVSWLTVLPLAVVLAFADGFWVASLRGAVGAIERTQTPFVSWVRESALTVPLFTLAVLGALTLTLHLFGASAHRPRQVLVAGLLVTAAATVAGVAVLAASSLYDYRLQVEQGHAMSTTHQICTGACLTAHDTASFWLQARSVGWGSLLLLGTNLVLVAWAVAFLGGRLRTGTPRPAGALGASRAGELRTLLVAGLAGSAVIHAAVVPEHLAEWSAAGVFFVLLATAELAAAGLLFLPAAGSIAPLAAAAVSLGPLLLWLGSRTTGMPFGPEAGEPEAVGVADVAACLLEVLTLVLAVALLRAHPWTRRRGPATRHGWRLAFVSLVAVTALGLAGTSLSWFTVLVEGSGHGG
jgi:hypothetical protein